MRCPVKVATVTSENGLLDQGFDALLLLDGVSASTLGPVWAEPKVDRRHSLHFLRAYLRLAGLRTRWLRAAHFGAFNSWREKAP